MRLEKRYTATLDVRDPDDYCANPRRAVINYLRQVYAGRCYRGAFILEILDVVRLSPCRLKDTTLNAEDYVDVDFRARVSVRDQWDILSGVRIGRLTPLILGRSSAEGALTVVSLLATPETRLLTLDLTIAVRLVQMQYTPSQEEVVAVGTLLTCDKEAPAFILEGALTRSDADALAPLLQRLRALLRLRTELVRRRRDDVLFFEQLLYAYALPASESEEEVLTAAPDVPPWVGPAGLSLPPGAAAVNLLDAAEAAHRAPEGGGPDVSGVWCRDLALYRSSPLASRARGPSPPSWPAPAASPPRAAFAKMLRACCEFLQVVSDYVEQFTPQTLESHQTIWRVMRGAQEPPPAARGRPAAPGASSAPPVARGRPAARREGPRGRPSPSAPGSSPASSARRPPAGTAGEEEGGQGPP